MASCIIFERRREIVCYNYFYQFHPNESKQLMLINIQKTPGAVYLVPGLGVGAPGEELGDHVGAAHPAGMEEGCPLVLTGEPGRRCGFKILL